VGRKSGARTLVAWVNGQRAGEWRLPSRGDQEFRYDPAWAVSAEGRSLSLSLPMTLDDAPLKGEPVEFYFDNLLPDSESIRKRVQARFRAASPSAFDLLAAIGRDCVGAVQLLPPGETPANVLEIEAKPLSDADVERVLARTTAAPAFPGHEEEDDLRISIAGVQEKTALLRHEGRWCRPLGATPTTHIFKLPLGLVGNMQADMRTSVENEWLCAKLLAAYGLPVASCEIGRFGAQKALIVERFDRQLHSSGRHWLRLVQEDFCQATGTPSFAKYEAEGGPGMLEIARILRGSADRDADLERLIKAQILFWMLAATDGHAKNFSLQILAGGRYRLTPLYDVLSAWPIIGDGGSQLSRHRARLAMALHGKSKHYRIAEIRRRHFNETAARCGVGPDAEKLIGELLDATPRAVAQVQRQVPTGFPQRVLDRVLGGLEESAAKFARQPPT
jgi:serine/threonine-protein kinase HipA